MTCSGELKDLQLLFKCFWKGLLSADRVNSPYSDYLQDLEKQAAGCSVGVEGEGARDSLEEGKGSCKENLSFSV